MPRRAPLLVVVSLLVASAAAGCLGEEDHPLVVTPYLPLNDAEPGRGTEFAFHIASRSPFRQDLDVRASGLPDGWRIEPETESVALPGRASTTLVVRVVVPTTATHGPHDVVVSVGPASARVIVNVKNLGDEPIRAGIGTTLHWIGWYDNGTLFGYSDATLEGRPIPYWPPTPPEDPNATREFNPLKVYAGGKRGTPPPEPYNSSGYVPVIPGFDARLRDAGNGNGMVGGETLAVRIPKERAYTYDGNEKHVLYGENLNFLIRIVSVDVLSPRTCELPVCPPMSR